MKKIKNFGAQGDVLFIRRHGLPPGVVAAPLSPEVVVSHSETGHHHVALGDASYYPAGDDGMLAYLVARGPIVVEHRRAWDTHEPLELLHEGGEVTWEIRRQREHTPQGWRRVED